MEIQQKPQAKKAPQEQNVYIKLNGSSYGKPAVIRKHWVK